MVVPKRKKRVRFGFAGGTARIDIERGWMMLLRRDDWFADRELMVA